MIKEDFGNAVDGIRHNSLLCYPIADLVYPNPFFGITTTDTREQNRLSFFVWYTSGSNYISDYVFGFEASTTFPKPYHVALIRKNNVMRIARNGIFSPNTITNNTMLFRNNDVNHIGYQDNNNFYANFTLDDYCIIKGRALWTSNFKPPTKYLPDIWFVD